MNDSALTVLKFCLMAMLYLFLARVVWVVASEMRVAKAAPIPEPQPEPVKGGPGPAKGRAWQLFVVAPKVAAGLRYAVDQEITIGRAPGCAIHLDGDSFVSSLHARVYPRDDAVWLEDLGSTNGTTVNGAAVAGAVRLRKGDRVQIGDTVLEARRA